MSNEINHNPVHFRRPVVNKQKLLRWLEDHFGEVRTKANHFLVNDPIGRPDGQADKGFNLIFFWSGERAGWYKSWLPPYRNGSLIKFISETDQITYGEAHHLVCDEQLTPSTDMIKEALDNLRANQNKTQELSLYAQRNAASLPPGFHAFNSPEFSELKRLLYHKMLDDRGIAPELFGLGYIDNHELTQREKDEKWPDMFARVVIPFYGPDGTILYWTARDSMGKKPKYFNMPPTAEERQLDGRSDKRGESAIWCIDWKKCKKLYVCEGIFDAMSLKLLGLDAIALTGANLSSMQRKLIQRWLKPEEIVVALDNDQVGNYMNVPLVQEFRARGFRVKLVTPPKGNKDWNELWSRWRNPDAMKAWILTNESSLTFAREIERELQQKLKLNFR